MASVPKFARNMLLAASLAVFGTGCGRASFTMSTTKMSTGTCQDEQTGQEYSCTTIDHKSKTWRPGHKPVERERAVEIIHQPPMCLDTFRNVYVPCPPGY